MKAQKSRKTKSLFFISIFIVVMLVLTCVPAMAAQNVDIAEGTYYIKAVNGNAKGQVLYWNEKSKRPEHVDDV